MHHLSLNPCEGAHSTMVSPLAVMLCLPRFEAWVLHICAYLPVLRLQMGLVLPLCFVACAGVSLFYPGFDGPLLKYNVSWGDLSPLIYSNNYLLKLFIEMLPKLCFLTIELFSHGCVALLVNTADE
jgi:hypothetical protein